MNRLEELCASSTFKRLQLAIEAHDIYIAAGGVGKMALLDISYLARKYADEIDALIKPTPPTVV